MSSLFPHDTAFPVAQEVVSIVKESIPDLPSRSAPGLLSMEIKRSVHESASKAAPGRVGLRLTIYLPTKSPFHVTVPVTATVEDVLQFLLRDHKREKDARSDSSFKALPTYDSRCYELRLPDSDDPTVPDEDIPGALCVVPLSSYRQLPLETSVCVRSTCCFHTALDRNRKIKGFSDDLEFCLCIIPGALDGRTDA